MIHGRPDHAAELRALLNDPHDVVSRLGLDKDAQRQGNGLTILCPAPGHSERTPSCSVTVGRDRTIRVRCFGCGFTGDVLTLIAAASGISIRDFRAVLEQAAFVAGVRLEDSGPPVPFRARPAQPPPPPPPPSLSDERFAELAAFLAHQGALDGSAVARDVEAYLDGRGLLEAARRDGWAALPPPGPTQQAWVDRLVEFFGEGDVELSGLAWADRRTGRRVLAHPENRLVIPWRSPSGQVYTVQRRRLDDAVGPRVRKYVFPRGESRAPRYPYGVDRIAPGLPVAVVEGAIDVLALRLLAAAWGRPCAPLGLAGVDQAERVEWFRFVGDVAIVGLDADKAGAAKSDQLAHTLATAGARRVLRWAPPGGVKDWALALGPSSRSNAA